MKNTRNFFLAMLLTGSIISCSTESENGLPGTNQEIQTEQSLQRNSPQNLAQNRGPSANGQGTLVAEYLGNQPQHFAFHASTDQQGNVSGSFESTAHGFDSRVHGTINCLTILEDGKTAIMSGVLTKVSGEVYVEEYGLAPGYMIWFKVVDNGQGANAEGDLFSDIYADVFLPSCNEEMETELLEIQNGNIQVKP